MTIATAVVCDGCDSVFVPDGKQPWGALTRLATEAGWTTTRAEGRFRNYCPDHPEHKEA